MAAVTCSQFCTTAGRFTPAQQFSGAFDCQDVFVDCCSRCRANRFATSEIIVVFGRRLSRFPRRVCGPSFRNSPAKCASMISSAISSAVGVRFTSPHPLVVSRAPHPAPCAPRRGGGGGCGGRPGHKRQRPEIFDSGGLAPVSALLRRSRLHLGRRGGECTVGITGRASDSVIGPDIPLQPASESAWVGAACNPVSCLSLRWRVHNRTALGYISTA